ncbi:translation initiation factor IF-2 N-terminal domain-containing protein [Nocardia carnea]|uniref:translation initiation factor IF-2 N-terminal domain-containing protein n=1 Tax=Nocardia carnea TaxID=37328 RepID=UPI002457C3BB|nr:translation initiation factor IF-2 N-terminal domain-containing protein [Nocardia carnea]
MADQEPLDTTSQDDDHLPERIRVHALAKRLGVTSKRILAKLSELGTEVRSPQSSVDRAVAESVRESLTTPNLALADPGLFEPAAAGSETGPAGQEGAANEPTAADEAGTSATDAETAVTGSEQAASPAPAPDGGSGQIPGIATETVAAGAGVWEPEEPTAPDVVAAGTGLAPEPATGTAPAGSAAAASSTTGEQGTAESGAADSGSGQPTAPGSASAVPAPTGTADIGASTGTTEPAEATARGDKTGTGEPAQRDRGAQAGPATGTEGAAEPSGPAAVSVSATVSTNAPTSPSTPPPAFTAAANLFASPVREEPTAAEPVVFESAVVAAPLFLSPDAAAAEDLRRRRKAEQQAEQQVEQKPERQVEQKPERHAEVEPSADSESDDETGDEQGGDSDDQPRRRRRGRRGRGRGRGEQQSEGDDNDAEDGESAETAEASAETEDKSAADEDIADQDAGDTGEESEGGSSRRRRRRRRRKVSGESGETADSAEDDPPNTVVHEREPRNKTRARATVDEVQGITGSTRLEAKRQRRRDGREAGRRRPPILTESEFLARRESVDRVMVVREKEFPGHPSATQVAVLEDNILVEHFVTSTGSASMVGNVYLGKVQNVLPSMEAAFVDIGRGRNGVLYAGEVNWEAAGLGGKERKIEQALKPGDQVLVQVSKDPVGHKGARLTTQISLAGRFLVYVPGGTSTGISRKLPDTERKRLKEILREIVPADAGVIIRTASEGVSEAELTRDVERLQSAWRKIAAAAEGESNAPKTLYEEPDLLVKVVRDLFNEDFSKLVIEGERSWNTVEKYIGTVAPDLLARVSRHENNGVDVFEAYRIDEQLAKALDRKVWLPSGGTLVIDRTEAMTVVDVNTGKFTGSGGGNLEETVTRNNLEAAEEIVRQMRLRDIGGMIVVDFIDMVLESNRDLVLRRLTEALGRDRTRHQVSEVTSLGLVQMTRKKLGTGLVEAFSTTCEHCHGRGILVHSYPVETGGGDEGAGRGRESGSKRRRNRDKAAPAAAAPAPVPEITEEDAAVKRAHPVALAMAAHQSEDAADEAATAADQGAAGEPAAATGNESRPDSGAPAEPRRRRTRVRRSAGAASSGDRPAAEANGSGARAVPEAAAADTSPPVAAGAPEAAADVPEPAAADAHEAAAAETADVAATETVVAEGAGAALTGDPVTQPEADEPATAGAHGVTGSTDAADAGDTSPVEPEVTAVPVSAVAEQGRPPADSGHAAGTPGEPVSAPNGTAAPAAAPNGTAASSATAGATQPESAGGGAPPVGGGTADSASEARTRRRRVARSTAAPVADSAGAVFVLAADEQPSVPVAEVEAEPAAADVPVRRVRRRAAARPARPRGARGRDCAPPVVRPPPCGRTRPAGAGPSRPNRPNSSSVPAPASRRRR